MVNEDKLIKNEDLIKCLPKKRQNKINSKVEKIINYFLHTNKKLR